MKWLHNVTLENEYVQLVPLEQKHKADLIAAATDGRLWELWYTSVPHPDTMMEYIDKQMKDFEEDKSLPFVVIDKKSNKIIGATRYLNASFENRRIEIGGTWYAKSFQKTYVNTACKLLLFTHAFETLNAVAVEFRTSWYNLASRNAIARLGAKQDGILRNHRIIPGGSFADTVVFSVLENEWKTGKISLQYKLSNYNKIKS